MNSFPKIIKAKAVKPYFLEIEFENTKIKYFNFDSLLNDKNFNSLSDYTVFKNFHIPKCGYGIEWNDEIDISEAELWLNGQESL